MKTSILTEDRDSSWRHGHLMKTGILNEDKDSSWRHGFSLKTWVLTEDKDSHWRQGFLLKTRILTEDRDSSWRHGHLMKTRIHTEDRDSLWRQTFFMKKGILTEDRNSFSCRKPSCGSVVSCYIGWAVVAHMAEMVMLCCGLVCYTPKHNNQCTQATNIYITWQHNHFCLSSTHKDTGRSLKTAYKCRNM
jgi:hypothetical protein